MKKLTDIINEGASDNIKKLEQAIKADKKLKSRLEFYDVNVETRNDPQSGTAHIDFVDKNGDNKNDIRVFGPTPGDNNWEIQYLNRNITTYYQTIDKLISELKKKL